MCCGPSHSHSLWPNVKNVLWQPIKPSTSRPSHALEGPVPSSLQQGWQIYCDAKVRIQSAPREDELLKGNFHGKSAARSSPPQEPTLVPLDKGPFLCSPELHMDLQRGMLLQ